jgi:phosphoglycolate phosphatase-like HAD superfamily hydrolase
VTRLILFDIDGTLVLTGGAGGRAMARAFAAVFGPEIGASLSYAGRTDAWILARTAIDQGVVLDATGREQFRAASLTSLAEEIHRPGPGKGVMPGVRRLLDTLSARDDAFLALLTGNFEGGARVKLEYFDLWRYFPCGAFGDEIAERNALLSDVLEKVAACGLAPPPADAVVIVGDTPHDVAVAAAGGARSVGVATGPYDEEALRSSGADVVLKDLSDLDEVLAALGFQSGSNR